MKTLTSAISVSLTTDHKIRVCVGHEIQYGDTYYLSLESNDESETATIQRSVHKLLASWIRSLCQAADGQLIYLPFDFADEYTKWIACQILGTEVSMVFGWAPLEGWSISPGQITGISQELSSFTPHEPLTVQAFYLPRVISLLRRSLALLNGCFTAPN